MTIDPMAKNVKANYLKVKNCDKDRLTELTTLIIRCIRVSRLEFGRSSMSLITKYAANIREIDDKTMPE